MFIILFVLYRVWFLFWSQFLSFSMNWYIFFETVRVRIAIITNIHQTITVSVPEVLIPAQRSVVFMASTPNGIRYKNIFFEEDMVYFFFIKSRISVRRTISSDGFGSSFGASSSFFCMFSKTFIITKTQRPMITKSITD